MCQSRFEPGISQTRLNRYGYINMFCIITKLNWIHYRRATPHGKTALVLRSLGTTMGLSARALKRNRRMYNEKLKAFTPCTTGNSDMWSSSLYTHNSTDCEVLSFDLFSYKKLSFPATQFVLRFCQSLVIKLIIMSCGRCLPRNLNS